MASGTDYGHARLRRKRAGHGGLGGTVDQYPNGGSRSPVPAGSRCRWRTCPGHAGIRAMADAVSGGLRRQTTVHIDA
jgi:hypothetical protein